MAVISTMSVAHHVTHFATSWEDCLTGESCVLGDVVLSIFQCSLDRCRGECDGKLRLFVQGQADDVPVVFLYSRGYSSSVADNPTGSESSLNHAKRQWPILKELSNNLHVVALTFRGTPGRGAPLFEHAFAGAKSCSEFDVVVGDAGNARQFWSHLLPKFGINMATLSKPISEEMKGVLQRGTAEQVESMLAGCRDESSLEEVWSLIKTRAVLDSEKANAILMEVFRVLDERGKWHPTESTLAAAMACNGEGLFRCWQEESLRSSPKWMDLVNNFGDFQPDVMTLIWQRDGSKLWGKMDSSMYGVLGSMVMRKFHRLKRIATVQELQSMVSQIIGLSENDASDVCLADAVECNCFEVFWLFPVVKSVTPSFIARNLLGASIRFVQVVAAQQQTGGREMLKRWPYDVVLSESNFVKAKSQLQVDLTWTKPSVARFLRRDSSPPIFVLGSPLKLSQYAMLECLKQSRPFLRPLFGGPLQACVEAFERETEMWHFAWLVKTRGKRQTLCVYFSIDQDYLVPSLRDYAKSLILVFLKTNVNLPLNCAANVECKFVFGYKKRQGYGTGKCMHNGSLDVPGLGTLQVRVDDECYLEIDFKNTTYKVTKYIMNDGFGEECMQFFKSVRKKLPSDAHVYVMLMSIYNWVRRDEEFLRPTRMAASELLEAVKLDPAKIYLSK